MNKIDQLISELSNESHFDSFEEFEELDGEGLKAIDAMRAPLKKRMTQQQQQGAASHVQGARLSNYGGLKTVKATAKIALNRKTSNIPATLPVPIFGALAAQGGYLNSGISMPTGVSITDVTFGVDRSFANAQMMQITYSDGLNTDIVEITCSTVPYPVFLQASLTDMFKVNRLRIGISDITGNNTDQFNQRILFVKKSLFGAARLNPVDLSTFNNPQNFKNNVIDVDVVERIDKETTMCVDVIQGTANFTVSVSAFIEAYDKHNAQSERL